MFTQLMEAVKTPWRRDKKVNYYSKIDLRALRTRGGVIKIAIKK
jgi:hypothetical protein